MAKKPTTVDDLFDHVESTLDRRARERREAEKAYDETPQGKREAEARSKRWAEQQAKYDAEPEPVEETDEDENDDEGEDEE